MQLTRTNFPCALITWLRSSCMFYDMVQVYWLITSYLPLQYDLFWGFPPWHCWCWSFEAHWCYRSWPPTECAVSMHDHRLDSFGTIDDNCPSSMPHWTDIHPGLPILQTLTLWLLTESGHISCITWTFGIVVHTIGTARLRCLVHKYRWSCFSSCKSSNAIQFSCKYCIDNLLATITLWCSNA